MKFELGQIVLSLPDGKKEEIIKITERHIWTINYLGKTLWGIDGKHSVGTTYQLYIITNLNRYLYL